VEEIRAAVEGMRDPRFRLVEHKENRGPAAARNTGTREAKADFVIYIDEDDKFAEACLETEIQELLRGDCDIVICPAALFGGREGLWEARVPTMEEVLYSQTIPGCGFLIRKEVWAQVGGWDEDPEVQGREDNDWWIRVVGGNFRFKVIDSVLYWYRTYSTEWGKRQSLNLGTIHRELRVRQRIIAKHRDLYEQYPESKLRFLRKGYLLEADLFLGSGRRLKGILRLWQAACLTRWRKDARSALRATVEVLLGKKVVRYLLAWARMA
jgi:glycosyltransferase involved in cell wall biosynthesis